MCNASGQWYQNKDQNKEWSNYTMCARDDVSPLLTIDCSSIAILQYYFGQNDNLFFDRSMYAEFSTPW